MAVTPIVHLGMWAINKGANYAVVSRIKTHIRDRTGVQVSTSFALEYNRVQMGLSTAGGSQNAISQLNTHIEEMGGLGNLELGTLQKTDARDRIARGQTYQRALQRTLIRENPNVHMEGKVPIKELESYARTKRREEGFTPIGNARLARFQSIVETQIEELKQLLDSIVEESGGDRRNPGQSKHNLTKAELGKYELQQLLGELYTLSPYTYIDDSIFARLHIVEKGISVLVHVYGDSDGFNEELVQDWTDIEWYHYIDFSGGVSSYVDQIINIIEGVR